MFPTIYSIVAVLFVVSVLLQKRESDLGSMMGGGSGDEIVRTRRGAERFIANLSVVLGILLIVGGAYAMFV